MITLSELYFLNSNWNADSIIRVALKDQNKCYYIKGKKMPCCDLNNYIVLGFSNDFVIVAEED